MERRRLLGLSLILWTTILAGPRAAALGDASTDTIVQDARSCPVTVPSAVAFNPPSPYPSTAPYGGNFWYGTEDLWTLLRVDGTWRGLLRNANGLRQKVFWWHPGFDGRIEPAPELTVSGRRLDAPGSFVHAARATNAHHPDFGGWTILTGVDVPTTGCWELTGRYRGHSLQFVIWVSPLASRSPTRGCTRRRPRGERGEWKEP